MKTPEHRMDRIVARWFIEDPVMLGAWSLAEKVPSKHQKSIGIRTNTDPVAITYNPNFINSLTDDVLEAIMASEVFKILLHHATTRLKTPKEISALSSTITVDQLIMKNLLGVPGIGDSIPMPKDYGLENGLYHEEYFRQLSDKIEEVEQSLSNKFPECGEESVDENGFAQFENMKDALREYMNPNSTSSKDWGENEFFDADVTNFVNERKNSSSLWGSMSGNFLEQIVAANTPKISWKEIVRRFNQSVQTYQRRSSRMKWNRRYELDAPGHRYTNVTKIMFAIDISASMSDEDIAEGLAVLNNVCRHAEVHYMTFDTEIKQVETKFRKARDSFKVLGRGGTNPAPVIEYVNKHKYDGLVIYSDMGFSSNLTPPIKTKVLWLGHVKGAKPPVNFGYSAVLNRYE